MVQAIINLTDEENTYLNIFKAQRKIKSKNDAIKEMIRERIDKDREDLEFVRETEKILENHLKNENRSSISRKEFLEELETW